MVNFNVSDFDKSLGLGFYVSSVPGIGGVIKYKLEDFIVEEINEHGFIYKSSISGNFVPPPSPNSGLYTCLLYTSPSPRD